jgi:hypothetical protein
MMLRSGMTPTPVRLLTNVPFCRKINIEKPKPGKKRIGTKGIQINPEMGGLEPMERIRKGPAYRRQQPGCGCTGSNEGF